MQSSRYNIFTKCNFKDGYDVVYQPFAQSLILVPSETARALEKNELDKIDQKELQKHLKQGIVVEDRDFELAEIKLFHWRRKMDTRKFGMTLIPTYLCNFKCPYCYEAVCYDGINDDKEMMSSDICDSIIELTERKIKEGAKSVNFEWYGGEPLLALDIVIDMTKRLTALCKEKEVTFDVRMVSNGYLLDEETAKKLGDIGISNIQITLDGLASSHDKQRALRDSGPTFDRIVENLKNAYKHIKQIIIRVNVGADNQNAAAEVREYLKENIPDAENITIYLSQLLSEDGSYLDEDVFACENDRFIENGDKMEDIDLRKSAFCMLNNPNAIVIDCKGDVFDCWEWLSEENVVGKLQPGGKIKYNKRFYEHVFYDPTEDEKCKDCCVLPLCMGGCKPRQYRGMKCEALIGSASEINRKLNGAAAKLIFGEIPGHP